VLEARPDFSWIDPDFADVAETAGQFIPSLIGAALVALAIKMSQRVKLAWGATIVMLVFAAIYTVLQGEQYWIPGVLLTATLLIVPFQSAFYRATKLFSGPMDGTTALALLGLTGCVIALAAFEPHVNWLDNDTWWAVVLSPDVSNSLRASVAASVVIGMVAIGRLLRPGHVESMAWTQDTRQRFAALGALPPVDADGVVWGEAGRAAIAYRHVGGVLLALGDPVGAPGDRTSAIWRLRDLAGQEGLDPAVWLAGPSMLKIYANLGLSALKLGEDGMPAAEVDPELSSAEESPNTRYLVCKAGRDLRSLLPVLPQIIESTEAD
jgi:phosphatidylglycerol lysyltransferase